MHPSLQDTYMIFSPPKFNYINKQPVETSVWKLSPLWQWQLKSYTEISCHSSCHLRQGQKWLQPLQDIQSYRRHTELLRRLSGPWSVWPLNVCVGERERREWEPGKTIKLVLLLGYKCYSSVCLFFWHFVSYHLQVHYHHPLDCSSADPDLHVAQENQDRWNQICDLANEHPHTWLGKRKWTKLHLDFIQIQDTENV